MSSTIETAVLSGTFTASANGADFTNYDAARGYFFLNITAASGTTPSLTLKLQAKCDTTGVYYDVPGAAFAAKTAAGSDMLVVKPGVAAVANQAVSQPVPSTFRWVATITGTTPSFTFTLHYE